MFTQCFFVTIHYQKYQLKLEVFILRHSIKGQVVKHLTLLFFIMASHYLPHSMNDAMIFLEWINLSYLFNIFIRSLNFHFIKHFHSKLYVFNAYMLWFIVVIILLLFFSQVTCAKALPLLLWGRRFCACVVFYHLYSIYILV